MLLEKLVIPIGFDTGLLLQGLDLIEGAIGKVVDVAGEAIDRTKAWAEDLDRLGDVTGMASDELAAWGFVAKKAGVPVDSLSRGLVILEKGLVKADGTLDTMGKTLKDYGINVFGANGKLKTQSDLMAEISKQYNGFATQQEKVNFLTAVFGRSGADLVDIFDTLASEGGIEDVTQKIEKLGLAVDPTLYENFQRNLNEIDATFTGLSAIFTGPLLPGASALVETFKEWLQSPWVSEAIAAIGQSLGTLLSDISVGISTGDWGKFFGDASAIWEALKGKVEQALEMGIQWLDANPTAITEFIDRMLLGFNNAMASAPTDRLTILANDFASKLGAQLAAVDWGTALKSFWDTLSKTPPVGMLWGQQLGEQTRQAIINQAAATVIVWQQNWQQFAQIAAHYVQQIRDTIAGIRNSIQSVIDKVYEFRNALLSLVLPDWLTPGSPTPLELGIRGISGALNDLNGGGLPSFDVAAQVAPAAAPSNGFEFDYYKLAQILAAEVAKVTN